MVRDLSIHWVLRGQLALGPAPTRVDHLSRLEAAGIRSVLSLCAVSEAPPPPGLDDRFTAARQVLADHRSAAPSSGADLLEALALLEQLLAEAPPVYVHCVAAVERSPLVCVAWLMRNRGLSRLQALDYVMAIHPSCSPLPSQLQLLDVLGRSQQHRSEI